MKWKQISEETFLEKFDEAEFMQNDGCCFGINVNGKLNLYIDNGTDFIVDFFEKDLNGVFHDNRFHEALIKRYADFSNISMVSSICKWINEDDCNIEKYPCLLDDIHYSDYNDTWI